MTGTNGFYRLRFIGLGKSDVKYYRYDLLSNRQGD